MTVTEILNMLRYADKTHTNITLGANEAGMIVAAIDATKKIAELAAQDNKKLRIMAGRLSKNICDTCDLSPDKCNGEAFKGVACPNWELRQHIK